MKEIRLTQGKFAIIDDCYLKTISGLGHWQVKQSSSGNWYATKTIKVDEARESIAMHLLIWQSCRGIVTKGFVVDHINRDSLDNRLSNLRLASLSQSMMNRRKFSGSGSRYKGVSYYAATKKWSAYICINGKQKHLGYFQLEKDAAEAYNKAAEVYYREYACVNVVE